VTGAALRLAKGSGYVNAGTVEFLVQGDLSDPKARYIFLEVSRGHPRTVLLLFDGFMLSRR